jgi:hypothetical protein
MCAFSKESWLMGDDLTVARRFCDSVQGELEGLIEAVCAQPCAAPDVLIGSLDKIQAGAKSLHARAIFRAAQTVVNAVNDRAPLPTVQGRVLSLNKLFLQYESGLNDIAPRPANIEGDTEIEDVAPKMDAIFSCDAPPMPDIEARYRAARAGLVPLMGLAKVGVERESLTKLADFSDDELEGLQVVELDEADGVGDDTSLDITTPLEDLTDVAAPDVAEINVTALTSPVMEKSQTAAPVSFENLMDGFITQALHEARLTEKTVSVSYAADGVTIGAARVAAAQNVLDHIARTCVRSILERPEARRARGQSGAGHIAVTVTQNQSATTISIECPGAPLGVSAFMPPQDKSASRLEGLMITPGPNAADDLAHIVVSLPRARKEKLAESMTVSAAEIAS